MVFGFRKSNDQKIQELYAQLPLNMLDFLDVSKKQSNFHTPLLEYVTSQLNIHSNLENKIVVDVYSFVSAKDINSKIQHATQSLSKKEVLEFTDLFLSIVSILEMIGKQSIPYKEFPKRIKALKQSKIKKDEILKLFGVFKSYGLFKKKVLGFEIYQYYILYLILEKCNLLEMFHNYLKKDAEITNIVKPNVSLLQGLLLQEIKNSNKQILIPLSDTLIDIRNFEIPISSIVATAIYENNVFSKDSMKHKIKEFYESNTINDYLDAFLNITQEQWSSNIHLIVQIIKEEHPMWKENIFQLLSERKQIMQIAGLKKSLTTDDIPNVDLMDGIEFEKFLGTLFEKMGFSVMVTKASGDQGTDLIIRKKSEIISVQAKRYSEKVTNTAIQEVVGSLKFYDATKGMVVTTNDFTKSARELASSNNVELINREKLNQMIIQYW